MTPDAAREFAVIVAGVLCALLAQAWWQGREERGRERDHLRQILSDTRENERRLDAALALDTTAARNMARAIDALTSGAPPPPPEVFVGWVADAGSFSDFRPMTGSYRALLGTGDLRLVRNDSLRGKVVSYFASVDAESERLRQFRGAMSDGATGMARSLPFMRRVFLDGPTTRGVDMAQLRADPEAVALLFGLQASAANRISGLRSLQGETRAMRRALEAEPGVRSP